MFATQKPFADSSGVRDIERVPMHNVADYLNVTGKTDPVLQTKAQRLTLERPNDKAPADVSGNIPASYLDAPQLVRTLVAPTLFESRPEDNGPLTGSHNIPDLDPEGRGALIEPAKRDPSFETTDVNVTLDPQRITNEGTQGAYADTGNMTPCEPHGEMFQVLQSFRANFPFVPVFPLTPSARLVNLVAATSQDIPLPDGAVVGFISGPADLVISVAGSIQAPAAGIIVEGMFKPNPNVGYYVKNTRTISFFSTTGGLASIMIYSQR